MSWLRALAFPGIGVVLFAAASPAVFALRPSVAIDFRADLPRRVAAGFYPAEVTPDGLTFAWTRESFALTLPGLDRRVPWQLTLRVAASRPDGTGVDLLTSVDGVALSRVTLPGAGFIDHLVPIAPRADPAGATTISFRVTPSFMPPADPRVLGVQLDRIDLAPAAGRPRLRAPWLPRLIMGAAAGALAAIVAVPASTALLWLAATALASAFLWAHGTAAYVGIPWVPAVAIAAAAAAIAAALLPRRRAGAAAVVLITFTAALLQMQLLTHPDMSIGDALFHAHKFQDVLAGRYYFTSIAPGQYQFPYPIGLYVVAAPFSRFTGSDFENAALLRAVVVVFNAAGAALLYRVVARWRAGDEIAAAGAVGAFHALPLGFGIIAIGNLTNAFAQAVALMTLAAAAPIASGGRPGSPAVARMSAGRWLAALVLSGLTTAAFLSHTGTFALLAVQLVLAGAWLLIAGSSGTPGARRRGAGAVILLAAAGAAIVAILVYYAQFGDVYREALARIAAESGGAPEAAGGRTPRTRLLETPGRILLDYGAPMLVLFGAGLIAAFRSRRSIDRGVGMLIAAWLAAPLLFLAIGIITPVDLRHLYAALPAVAAIAGLGLSWLWRAGAWTAAAAVLLAVWAGWTLVARFLG